MNHTLERLNKLQVSTWNMLKINDTSVAIDLDGMPAYTGNPLQKNYSGLRISREPALEVTENPPASLRDIKGYAAAFCNYRLYITIPAGSWQRNRSCWTFISTAATLSCRMS